MAPVVAHSLENLQPSVKALADTGVKTVPSIYVKDETDRPKVPYNAFSKEIPVIDIAGLIGERRSGIVADIGRACSEWGIFQIINHGVTKSLTERIRAEAFEFFAMPLEEKTVYAAKPGQFVGYANGSILTDEKYMDWRELITLRCFPIGSRNEDQWPRKPESFRYYPSCLTLCLSLHFKPVLTE
ncbi:hypothetical protein O6H91_18G045400 [Diphasiastrum complanatum]|uniref:Uncharacterized protein n=1 Tax=Diphasiastrum complanatum TaxID=34168 RepID=A0ACC2B1T0_DIPCM|nr:hypothetical protein O6H91_18G045400 [Diphasiastrum complanatum]